jgi:LmbE family N-acetylglucosaminyl deacetylase
MIRRALLLFAAIASLVAPLLGRSPAAEIPQHDRGAVAAWEKILKLQTVASIMHTTAHPDDEHGGMLALLGRGKGVRTALLTLTRGEAGDNAIGPELFDALGLVRTDELAIAAQYYGLDEQYFTSAADYGFSKHADEALTKWDRRALLGDMVRAIRASRPLVVISRWQGTGRDGHGQHQAAGLLTPEAVLAAADPRAFPELADEGLRPWRVRKVYSGGWREGDSWQVAVDPGIYAPLLGDSFTNVARIGLSLQRSQTAGRLVRTVGPTSLYYQRVDAPGGRERDFFDGLETSVDRAYRLLERAEPAGAAGQLRRISEEAAAAMQVFRFTEPSAAALALARGLAATREALGATSDDDVAFLLGVKERQFEDALAATLGLELYAVAEPPGTTSPTGPYAAFAPPPTLAAMTGGASIDVAVSFVNHSNSDVAVEDVAIDGAAGRHAVPLASADVRERAPGRAPCAPTPVPCALTGRLTIEIPFDAPVTRPYFSRRSIAETRYTLRAGSRPGRPWDAPSLVATARYRFNGISSGICTTVVRREAALPDGYREYELEILPPASVTITPAVSLVRIGDAVPGAHVAVEVTNFADEAVAGMVRLQAPHGWTVKPASAAITLPSAGDRQRAQFNVSPPPATNGVATLSAVLTTRGREWRADYTPLRHRDLPLRYFVKDAAALVTVADLRVDRGVRVGYAMGIGDEIPAALERLGARVTTLTAEDLASGDLARFDTIVTGTRAYAVRSDLRRHNRRLLQWVRDGGNLIVLYNTPEFDPQQFAPYGATLPQDAEEVSEEDAAVALLAPEHPQLRAPNRITAADFDGWVEQRGSKFFSTWDQRYTPLAESHDRGQAPQQGGWLTTSFGKGRWTYMAYALHRQVPYGVPGAYRILANLIARR